MFAIFRISPLACIDFPNMPAGLALMIGSREAFLFQTPGCLLPAGQTGGRAVRAFRRDRLFHSILAPRRQPASDALREGTKALPCVGSLHVLEHGASHAREVVKVCRRLGNVCRA